MKGKLKEDHHTADGALYKGDIVTINTMTNGVGKAIAGTVFYPLDSQ